MPYTGNFEHHSHSESAANFEQETLHNQNAYGEFYSNKPWALDKNFQYYTNNNDDAVNVQQEYLWNKIDNFFKEKEGKPQKDTTGNEKHNLAPHSETQNHNLIPKLNFTEGKSEITQELSNTDELQVKNTTNVNKHPIDVERGDIGPEETVLESILSKEFKKNNTDKKYKTLNEIESLSLTKENNNKEQRNTFEEPITLNATGLNQKEERQLSTVTELSRTSTLKPNNMVGYNNLVFIPNVENSDDKISKHNSFITPINSDATNTKQDELKQIQPNIEQQDMKQVETLDHDAGQQIENFEQSWNQQSQQFEQQFAPQYTGNFEPFEEKNMGQSLEPFVENNMQQYLETLSTLKAQNIGQTLTKPEPSQQFENQNKLEQVELLDEVSGKFYDVTKQQPEKPNYDEQYFQRNLDTLENMPHISHARDQSEANSQTNNAIEQALPKNEKEIVTPKEPTTEKPGFWNSVWNKTKSAKDTVVSWFSS